MKKEDLRIGNYVLIDNPKTHPNLLNQPVQVVGIQSRNETLFLNSNASISVEVDIHNGFSQFNEFIKPIPLIEDWLLKFGFDHREFSFDKGSFYLMKRTGKNEYLYQAHTKRFQVKYVHQLQNLYFALTAIELTVA